MRPRSAHQEEHGRSLRVPCDGTAERILRALAGQRQKHATVLARVDVGAAGAVTARIVPRSADDDILVAIAVDVAGSRDVTAECVGPVLRAKGQQHAAIVARLHLHVSAARRTGDDVGCAVLIGIAC